MTISIASLLVREGTAWTWKSRDGRVTKIESLPTDHLRNILRMLYRAALTNELAALRSVSTFPDDDTDWVDDIADRRPSESLLAEVDNIAPLLGEWSRRGFAYDAWSAPDHMWTAVTGRESL